MPAFPGAVLCSGTSRKRQVVLKLVPLEQNEKSSSVRPHSSGSAAGDGRTAMASTLHCTGFYSAAVAVNASAGPCAPGPVSGGEMPCPFCCLRHNPVTQGFAKGHRFHTLHLKQQGQGRFMVGARLGTRQGSRAAVSTLS